LLAKPYGFEKSWYYVTEPRTLADLRMHGREVTYLIPFWYEVKAERPWKTNPIRKPSALPGNKAFR